MTMTTTQIRDLLRPGLNSVFGDYELYQGQWRDIFETHTSDKAVEYDVEMRFLGLASLKQEGASVAYDSGMGQRYTSAYLHRYVGLGFLVTRQAQKDNLYTSQFPRQAKALKKSFGQTKDTLGAAVINNMTDGTNYPGGDNVALLSTAHPIDTGTYANRATNHADINEASLEDAFITIQGFRDQAGLTCATKARKLIVPRQSQFIVKRLLGNEWQPDSANRNVNAIQAMNMLPEGFSVNQFFTDTDAWIIKTDADDGFKYFQREAFETTMYTDPDNDNLKVKGIERYSFGWSNPRCVWGSTGA